jgi:Ca2+-binding EF-hand superfamily protein
MLLIKRVKVGVSFLAVIVVGVASATCFAANTAPSAGDAELFNRLDANHNGAIVADEVTSENRALFDRLLRKGDKNQDKSLSRDEFVAALVPSRPEKAIEAKQPSGMAEADEVRYLLLKLDTNSNARIEKDEVPKNMQAVFETILDRLDTNNDDKLDRQELSRPNPMLPMLAKRYVEREGIDVKVELAKIEKSQGSAAKRFDGQPMALERLRDPKEARQMFKELDNNADGYIEMKELPEPLRERFERFISMSDRDRDKRLSEQEFLDGTERLSRFLNRQAKDDRRDLKAMKAERKSKSANSASSDKK